MNANLLAIVNRIVAEQGEGILAEPRRITAFFADLAKNEPKPQKNALVKCLEHGFAQTLKNAAEPDRAICKQRLAQRLNDEEGLDLGLCGDTIELLTIVLFGEEQKKKEAIELLADVLLKIAQKKKDSLCKNCGKELQEGWKTCPYCSTPTKTIAQSGIGQVKPDTPSISSNDTVDIPSKCISCHNMDKLGNKCTHSGLSIYTAAKYCVQNNTKITSGSGSEGDGVEQIKPETPVFSNNAASQTQQPVQNVAPTPSVNTADQKTVKFTGGQKFFVFLGAVGGVIAYCYSLNGVVNMDKIISFDSIWAALCGVAIMYSIFEGYNKSKKKKQ